MWKDKGQCLRNRDKTKNMPTGSKPQTTYAVFHGKYVNGGCCFNYGNTGNRIHYTGPGTLTALTFSKMTFWSKGTGDGPWPMVAFETGVFAGNTAKCESGAACPDCTSSGENANPSVPHEIVNTLFKHNGVDHWALKTGNAKTGMLSVNVDLSALPGAALASAKAARETREVRVDSRRAESWRAKRTTPPTTPFKRALFPFTASNCR